MICKVVYTHQADKDIARLPKIMERRVESGLDSISVQPFIGKKLKGELSHLRSLRIGEYRIIYKFVAKTQTVYIMTISPRGNAYHL